MTIASGDPPVLIVYSQLSVLVATDCPTTVDRILFGTVVAAGASGAATLNVPAALRVRNDMMGLRSPGHGNLLVSRPCVS